MFINPDSKSLTTMFIFFANNSQSVSLTNWGLRFMGLTELAVGITRESVCVFDQIWYTVNKLYLYFKCEIMLTFHTVLL